MVAGSTDDGACSLRQYANTPICLRLHFRRETSQHQEEVNEGRRFHRRQLTRRFLQPMPAPEKTLAEAPLHSGGTQGPLAAMLGGASERWAVILHDERRRSFVSHLKAAFRTETLRSWWDLLSREISWKRPHVGESLLPRSAAWLTQKGCMCRYTYGGTSWSTMTMPPWFLDITDCVCRACGLVERPNACNANYYEHGGESVGWHADDEPLFASKRNDTLIISLSLGATRRFEIRPRRGRHRCTKLWLGNGDICTMEGLTQKHYLHRIPRDNRRDTGARINLTWRWIVDHDGGCPLHRPCVGGPRSSMKHSVGLARPPPPPQPPPPAPTAGEHAAEEDAALKTARSRSVPPKPPAEGALEQPLASRRRSWHESLGASGARSERDSASGKKLCLRQCFLQPASCMCPLVG